jgi:hypothetical protein
MLTLLENLDNLEKHDQLDGMALNEALNVKSPLYGHHDEKSAYVVDDYPYGGYRTQIRFWVEAVPRKGFRFVSQTLNPKTNQWNKPKKSTYSDFAGCMYLDDKSHVQFAGLGSYSSATDVLEFARSFPNSGHGTILKKFAATYIKLLSQYMDGSAVCTINGEPRPFSDADQARHKAEYEQWVQVAQLVGGAV